MKFYSEPNELVRTRIKINNEFKLKTVCQFDNNGEFETEDETLIEKLKPHFKYENNSFKCKKCEFETDNNGKLLAHYRKEHPKEG